MAKNSKELKAEIEADAQFLNNVAIVDSCKDKYWFVFQINKDGTTALIQDCKGEERFYTYTINIQNAYRIIAKWLKENG